LTSEKDLRISLFILSRRTEAARTDASSGKKMSKNLYEANAQWATRPDDERFESLEAMYRACRSYAEQSREFLAPLQSLRAEADNGDIKLIGKGNQPARLTHYAFGQFARLAGAPPSYLRALPATLATQCINHGIKEKTTGMDTSDKLNVLAHSLLVRALTSDSYDRVWNFEVIQKIGKHLAEQGWVVPPARPSPMSVKGVRPATKADILPNQGDFGLAVKEGDLIAPAGLYASDHDMFAFLVNHLDPVFDGQKYLNRGVFIQNSEVGDCALKFKVFTYDNVCGNHIVWGVGDVTEVSVRHIKREADRHGQTLQNGMMKWNIMSHSLSNAKDLEVGIKAAQSKQIAAKKEDVLDAVFAFAKKKGLLKLTKGTLEAGYEIAEKTPRYGAPTTVWGLVNGLTEHSQTVAWTDERNDLDVQAGRLMEMAF